MTNLLFLIFLIIWTNKIISQNILWQNRLRADEWEFLSADVKTNYRYLVGRDSYSKFLVNNLGC